MVHAFIFWFILKMLVSGAMADPYPKEKLSDYNFFQGRLADLAPAADVYPYTINTPLFSNYSEKLRFIKLPSGEKMSYRDSGVFDFDSRNIFKSFGIPDDDIF